MALQPLVLRRYIGEWWHWQPCCGCWEVLGSAGIPVTRAQEVPVGLQGPGTPTGGTSCAFPFLSSLLPWCCDHWVPKLGDSMGTRAAGILWGGDKPGECSTPCAKHLPLCRHFLATTGIPAGPSVAQWSSGECGAVVRFSVCRTLGQLCPMLLAGQEQGQEQDSTG